MARFFLFALLPLLAACASRVPAPVGEVRTPTRVEPAAPTAPAAPADTARIYTVKRGDTLIAIALDHGLDYRELAAWNNIENPSRIQVGQQLRLDPPAGAAPAASAQAAEVRPVAAGGAPVARPLDAGGAVPPAPTSAPSANTERVKREPKGGKLPYSEENLALLRGAPAAPPPVRPVEAAPPVQPAVSSAPPPAGGPAVVEVAGVEWSWPAQGRLLTGFNESRPGQEVNKGIDIGGRVGDPVLAAAAGRVIYVGVFPKHGNLAVLLHAGGYSSVYAHNSRILVKEGQTVTRGQKIAELGDSDADQPKLHFEVRHQGKPVDPLKFLPPRS